MKSREPVVLAAKDVSFILSRWPFMNAEPFALWNMSRKDRQPSNLLLIHLVCISGRL